MQTDEFHYGIFLLSFLLYNTSHTYMSFCLFFFIPPANFSGTPAVFVTVFGHLPPHKDPLFFWSYVTSVPLLSFLPTSRIQSLSFLPQFSVYVQVLR